MTGDRRLNAAAARTDAIDAEAARNEIARLEQELKALDDRLAKEFPDHAQLTRPRPLGIAQTQAALANDGRVSEKVSHGSGSVVLLRATAKGGQWLA